MKCYCGCGNEADRKMDDSRAPDLLGAPYESRCWIHFPGDAEEYCAKLRAGKEREAKACVAANLRVQSFKFAPYGCEDCSRPLQSGECWSTGNPDQVLCRPCYLRAMDKAKVTVFDPAQITISIGGVELKPMRCTEVEFVSAPTCLDCKSQATHDSYCVYCFACSGFSGDHAKRDAVSREWADKHPASIAARARMSAWSEREKPRSTASSRELAKPHPWEEFE